MTTAARALFATAHGLAAQSPWLGDREWPALGGVLQALSAFLECR